MEIKKLTEGIGKVTDPRRAWGNRQHKLEAPLRKIRGNYEKPIIALDCDFTQTQDGIKAVRVLDFLLS